MEFIDNRAFLIISAKRPMAEWIAKIDNEDINPAVEEHKSIYLVPPLDIPTDEQVEKLLERHFPAIFENELFSWYTDRSTWPSERNFERFLEWFHYEYVDEGFDTETGTIEKE